MVSYFINNLTDILCYIGLSSLISIVFALTLTTVMYRQTHKWSWIFCLKWWLFVSYLIVMLQVVLLSREPGSRTATDLIPFSTWHTDAQSQAYFVENFIMFLPMGLFLYVNGKRLRQFRITIFLLLGSSLLIEATQFITRRGFFQTDDIIMNVLGGAVGWGICYIVYKIKSAESH